MTIKAVIIPVCIGVLLFLGLLFILQRSLLFPRHLVPDVAQHPDLPEWVEQLWVTDGTVKVESWFLQGKGRSSDSPGPLVIFAHGNGEVIDHAVHAFQPYLNHGISVALLEYRGYGRSGGSPSEAGIVSDGVRLYDQLVQRKDVDPNAVIFHGRSLGGGVVCGMARERQPIGLILESTFTSVRDRAAEMWVPGFIIRDPFDNLEVVRRLSVPILIMHGVHDEIISVSHGEALAAAAQNAELHLWPTGHNDLAGDGQRYWSAVHHFVDGLLGASNQ